MEAIIYYYREYERKMEQLWDLRDKRVDGYFMMDSIWPTLAIVALYVYIVKIWGPNFMKDRKPYNINTFLIFYNAFQVIVSAYLFIQMLRSGWGTDYSYKCQPVDYSNSPNALMMLNAAHLYYLSKFSEFVDTFCFVARKKYNQVSLLHVVHHGILPISVWPGARYFPGGHATFFGFINVFVHFFMYAYYLLAALGPQYRKYLWWKQHLTTLQMVQFVGIMVHGFQLVFYDDCDFPWQFAYYIGAHAVLFFGLFSEFYIRTYFNQNSKKVGDSNGNLAQNGIHSKSE